MKLSRRDFLRDAASAVAALVLLRTEAKETEEAFAFDLHNLADGAGRQSAVIDVGVDGGWYYAAGGITWDCERMVTLDGTMDLARGLVSF